LIAEVKRELGSRSDLLLACAAVLAPFMVGYQVVEWGGTGIPGVNFVIYSPAWNLYGVGGSYGSWSGFGTYVAVPGSLMQLALALLGVLYVSAIVSNDNDRYLAIAYVLCALNLLSVFGLALFTSLIPRLFIPPGMSHVALALTIRYNLCIPTPLLALLGLYILRRRHHKQLEIARFTLAAHPVTP
jgi:hypothetical protein